MSRIGRAPIELPKGVELKISQPGRASVKGPKGSLEVEYSPRMEVEVEDGTVTVVRPSDNRLDRAQHGLARTLLSNAITGVTQGYEKKLEIVGTGYRVMAKGADLEFALGYSHPIVVTPPEGVTFAVDGPTRFSVSGIDKQKVGEVAANIRKLRKPDPYKGKGIRYSGEQIKRKVGKAGKR